MNNWALRYKEWQLPAITLIKSISCWHVQCAHAFLVLNMFEKKQQQKKKKKKKKKTARISYLNMHTFSNISLTLSAITGLFIQRKKQQDAIMHILTKTKIIQQLQIREDIR